MTLLERVERARHRTTQRALPEDSRHPVLSFHVFRAGDEPRIAHDHVDAPPEMRHGPHRCDERREMRLDIGSNQVARIVTASPIRLSERTSFSARKIPETGLSPGRPRTRHFIRDIIRHVRAIDAHTSAAPGVAGYIRSKHVRIA